MSKYRIRMDGKVYEMEIELVEEGPAKAPAKKTPEKPVPDKSSDKPQKKAVLSDDVKKEKVPPVNEGTMTSPMPGSVLEICVSVGQKVSEGDIVIILETMKMENEICASKDGVIKAIHVREGQTVSADAPLFDLEG